MRVKELLALMEDDPQWLGPAGVWLRPYGVSIAALIGHWHAVDHDVEQVAADYKIPLPIIVAAVDYYEQHQSEIDTRLALDAA
jgi:hypothetical protein